MTLKHPDNTSYKNLKPSKYGDLLIFNVSYDMSCDPFPETKKPFPVRFFRKYQTKQLSGNIH